MEKVRALMDMRMLTQDMHLQLLDLQRRCKNCEIELPGPVTIEGLARDVHILSTVIAAVFIKERQFIERHTKPAHRETAKHRKES